MINENDKRNKASVAHTGWNKRKNNSTTTPKNHTDIYDSSKKMKNETKRHESRDR